MPGTTWESQRFNGANRTGYRLLELVIGYLNPQDTHLAERGYPDGFYYLRKLGSESNFIIPTLPRWNDEIRL